MHPKESGPGDEAGGGGDPEVQSGKLDGKVVIVTGASKRLGRCYALALANQGARVVALARSLGDDPNQVGTLAEVVETARQAGGEVTASRCDLGDEAAIRRTVDEVVARFGGIDGVVNNAIAAVDRMDAMNVPQDIWEDQMRINVRAPYLLTVLAAPSMKARGGGSIINITSMSGGTTGRGGGAHKGLVHYGVSKAALNRLTTYFAAEFEPDDIAVNSLSPGDAAAYMRMVNGVDEDAGEEHIAEGQQLDEKFWGGPVVYLTGARPADVTGQNLHTYTFGETWGPPYPTPPQWSPEVLKVLGRDNLSARPD
jgi:NAD(P)-dependent dehydrogenase (short-subunit alcohol dehydrogenase family)